MKRGFIIIFLIVFAFVAIIFIQQRREKPAEVEPTAESPEKKPETTKGKIPSGLLDSIREALSPKEEKKTEERDYLKDEEAAVEAEGLLRRLIELDPNKDKEAIAAYLDEIRRIGYPAIKPLREMLKIYKDEKRVLLLLHAIEQIPDVYVNEDLKTLAATNPSKKVRDKGRAMFMARATPEEQQSFIKDTSASLTTSKTTTDKQYQIESLAAVGGEEAFATLKQIAAADSDDNIRRKAIAAIGGLQTPESKDFLLDVLKNEPQFAQAAAQALAKPPSDAVTEKTITIIEEVSDQTVRAAAINLLGQQGTLKAGDYLVKLIRTSDSPETMRAAANAIGTIAFPETAQSLVNLLKEGEDINRRRAVVAALGRMGDSAIPVLKGTILKYDGNVRVDAIRALSQTRKPAAYETLKTMVEEWRLGDDTAAQRELLTGLRNFGKKDIIDSVVRIAKTASDESIRRTALEVSADLSKGENLDFIVEAFQHDSSDTVKRGALRLMRHYGNKDTAALLRADLLSGGNPELKRDIEKAIEEIEKRTK